MNAAPQLQTLLSVADVQRLHPGMSVVSTRKWMREHGGFRRGRRLYMTAKRLEDENERAQRHQYVIPDHSQVDPRRLAAYQRYL